MIPQDLQTQRAKVVVLEAHVKAFWNCREILYHYGGSFENGLFDSLNGSLVKAVTKLETLLRVEKESLRKLEDLYQFILEAQKGDL